MPTQYRGDGVGRVALDEPRDAGLVRLAGTLAQDEQGRTGQDRERQQFGAHGRRGLGRHDHDRDHDRRHEEHERLGGAGAERARSGQRGPLDRQRDEQQARQCAATAASAPPKLPHAAGTYPIRPTSPSARRDRSTLSAPYVTNRSLHPHKQVLHCAQVIHPVVGKHAGRAE